MYFYINDEKYDVVIEKKNNKNTYIRVKEDLKIHVSTNKWTSNGYIEKLLKENYNSIVKMIDDKKKKMEVSDKNYFLGREIDIVVVSNQDKPEIYNNKLYIRSKDKLDSYYKDIAFQIFEERLNLLHNNFDEFIPYPKLKIRKMTSRWGVCNKRDKSITLNLELIKKDIKYIDYVIIHELSHFIHFDHSKSFWGLVEKYCKDYKKLRKEMKE